MSEQKSKKSTKKSTKSTKPPKSRGLGDEIAKVTKATGVEKRGFIFILYPFLTVDGHLYNHPPEKHIPYDFQQ